MSEILVSVERQKRDVRAAAATLSSREARYLVDQYYIHQEMRIRAAGQVRAMSDTGEPHTVLDWLSAQGDTLETQIKGALDKYSMAHPVGRWMRRQKGIGPVIAAGYLANIDITRANTAGKIHAYCGLAPGRDKRKRGEKMTFNPALKRLAWITGECFKKLSKDDADAYYRRVYDARKAYELANNEAGKYADQAAKSLTEKKFGADTVARAMYEQGKLPLARIDMRAARYATKLFLSHLHEVWWKHEYGSDPAKPCPLPYAIAHLGHVDLIPPPD